MKTFVGRWARLLPVWAIVFFLLGVCLPALAALGGDVSSVEADRAKMKAEISVTQSDAYAVHEIKTPTRMVVREYVSSDGRVFGVAWQGPFMPDMKQILGTYFQQYSTAAREAKAGRPGRRPVEIQQPGLVVESSGHMHSYSGRAYDPGLVPSGVTANAIR